MTKPITNPITGKTDYHSFKMQKRQEKQANLDMKQIRLINDNGNFIYEKTVPMRKKRQYISETTVLHTQQKLLPALMNEQRTLVPYCQYLTSTPSEMKEYQATMVPCES